ncbi:hypothetical protein Tco_0969956 [Tanacetum coccineum]
MDDPNITMEEYIRLEEEKARRRGKVYNRETTKYGKIWYDGDVYDLRSVETKIPAIVFDDGFTSKVTHSYEPTVSSLNDNEIDFRISLDESDDEDYSVIFDKNSFSYKIISKTDSENDNDKVDMPSFLSPKPNVSYFDDLDFFKYFENEFPVIVYNDALTSKSDFLTEPTIINAVEKVNAAGYKLVLLDQAATLRSGPRPHLFYFIGITWLYSFSLCSVLKGVPSTIMVLRIPVLSACVHAKTFAFDFNSVDATEDPFLVCGKYLSGPLCSFISFVCRKYSSDSFFGAAYEWFTKECIGSITTWDNMLEKFILKFHHLSDHNEEETEEDDNINETDNIPENLRIEENLFNFETFLCEAYYEFKLNDDKAKDTEKPWLENGVPYQLCDHICEPYRFKNGGTKWPTCTSDIDGFCNGGELPGMVRVGSMTYFQDHRWYDELADGKLKDETLALKSKIEGSWGDATPGVLKFCKWLKSYFENFHEIENKVLFRTYAIMKLCPMKSFTRTKIIGFVDMKGPFDMSKLDEFVADPSAPIEDLLWKKPPSLQRPAPLRTQVPLPSSQIATPSSVPVSNPMSPPADVSIVKPQSSQLQ